MAKRLRKPWGFCEGSLHIADACALIFNSPDTTLAAPALEVREKREGILAGLRRLFVALSASPLRYIRPRSRSNQPPTVFGSNLIRKIASLRVQVDSAIRTKRAR